MKIESNIFNDTELYERIKNITWRLRVPTRIWLRAVTSVYEDDFEFKKIVDDEVSKIRIEQQEIRAERRGNNEHTKRSISPKI